MKILWKVLAPDWCPRRAAAAGLVATLVYSVFMEEDRYIIGNYFNDVQFIQGMLVGKESSKGSWLLSWGVHLLNGVALAQVYAALAKRWLPGPGWLKGSLFASGFVAAAWTLTPLADKYHPLIKDGEMPKLATWKSFWQNILRHLAFGITLGWLYRSREER
ncbi:hypothetical protein EPA93_27620 [Ktedonosporobacter rubrisoli]|uniref:DUF1440 domain-containing protein n=1 Tax=Ktedonosporobacter rubrisoli TaxID=2509675 RepID=A0A4P6JVX8_KTERU|nr:hypothetical protein [Ktedonosporobacter rubrisoli]QBD79543.1 hypothetical protein EPA93_27620 [Ktedonosporobacter rubrisoli]